MKRIEAIILLLSILFILTPSLTIFSLLSTHGLAKGGILLLFMLKMRRLLLQKKEIGHESSDRHGKRGGMIVVFVITDLIIHSLSIIAAISISAYLSRFQTYFFGSVFALYLFLNEADKKKSIDILGKKLTYIIILGILINVGLEFIIAVDHSIITNTFSGLFNNIFIDQLIFNVKRGRAYYESFNQAMVPFLFFFLMRTLLAKLGIRKKIGWAVLIICIIGLITILTLTSLNRTFFVMLIFSVVSSMWWLVVSVRNNRTLLQFAFGGIVVVAIIFFVGLGISSGLQKKTTIDRIVAIDDPIDQHTAISRIGFWNNAIVVALGHPLLGVGMGNYYEHAPVDMRMQYSLADFSTRGNMLPAFQFVHNTLLEHFVEAGVFALLFQLTLLILFIHNDIQLIQKKDQRILISFSFWSLFIFALLNPTTSIRYYVLFWLFRFIAHQSLNNEQHIPV